MKGFSAGSQLPVWWLRPLRSGRTGLGAGQGDQSLVVLRAPGGSTRTCVLAFNTAGDTWKPQVSETGSSLYFSYSVSLTLSLL